MLLAPQVLKRKDGVIGKQLLCPSPLRARNRDAAPSSLLRPSGTNPQIRPRRVYISMSAICRPGTWTPNRREIGIEDFLVNPCY